MDEAISRLTDALEAADMSDSDEHKELLRLLELDYEKATKPSRA